MRPEMSSSERHGRDHHSDARRPHKVIGALFISTIGPPLRQSSNRLVTIPRHTQHWPRSVNRGFQTGFRFRTAWPSSFPSTRRTHTMTMREAFTMLPLSVGLPLGIPDLSQIEWTVVSADVQLTLLILLIVPVWLGLWKELTERKVVASVTTRKVIHISCGPAFLALWPWYSNTMPARLLASSVPALFIAVLLIAGLSKPTDKASGLGRAMSRRGNARDVLQGPLYYTMVLLCVTLCLFKNVVGGIAMMQLCFGDGMAEVLGRRFGQGFSWPFSWASHKSIAGSFAFVLFGFVSSCSIVQWYSWFGLCGLELDTPSTIFSLAVISVVCAAVELAPVSVIGDDNVAIAIVAVLLSTVLL